MTKKFTLYTIIFILIFSLLVVIGLLLKKDKEKISPNGVKAEIEKTVIIKEIQNLQRLETVQETLQRQFSLELSANDLDIFGLTVLESKKTQRFLVTGYVSAGIDLSKLQQEDLVLDESGNKITITLPAPEVFDVNLIGEEIFLLSDSSSLLFSLQNINGETKRQRTEVLQRQLIATGKTSLLSAACEDNILTKASDQAAESIKRVFLMAKNDVQVEVKVEQATPESCKNQVFS